MRAMSCYCQIIVVDAAATAIVCVSAGGAVAASVSGLSLALSRRRRRIFKAQRLPALERLRSIDVQLLLSVERQLDALHPCIGYYHRPRVHLWALDQNKCPSSEFKVNFRVRQRDFTRFVTALHIPPFIVTENRSRFTDVEAVLIFLRRLSETGRDRTVATYVGRERSEISRVFKHVSCWIV